MSLEIGFRQVHDVMVVNIRGRITFRDGAFEFRESLRTVRRDGCRNILLDLSGTAYLDSSGLAVLVSESAQVKKQGGQIKLLNPTKRVVDLLVTTRLFPLFNVFDEEEAAVRSFGEMAAAGWNSAPRLGERGQSDGI
jgi:anti-sigma B factor antagonist